MKLVFSLGVLGVVLFWVVRVLFFLWGGEGFVVWIFSAMKRSWIEIEWLLQQPLRTETYRGKYTQVFSRRPRM